MGAGLTADIDRHSDVVVGMIDADDAEDGFDGHDAPPWNEVRSLGCRSSTGPGGTFLALDQIRSASPGLIHVNGRGLKLSL